MNPRTFFAPLLLASILALPAFAAPPTLAVEVLAIETAQSTELARLGEEILATTDPAEVLALQRCAAHVKLACRLALHEAQLASTPADSVRVALESLVEQLGERLEADRDRLPEGYVFDPLAALRPEVKP